MEARNEPGLRGHIQLEASRGTLIMPIVMAALIGTMAYLMITAIFQTISAIG